MEAIQAATQSDTRKDKVRRWYVLILLTLVYMLSVADRNIFAILLPHIKAEMHFTDSELGLLSGVAFGIFYAVLGIPIAYLADRTNRRNIIAASLAIFSVMTALCGLAGNFVQMLLVRMGVGVGEAGTSPPSHSMLSDYFPPHRRTMAMGVLTIGAFMGALLGFVAGGAIAEQYGWRYAFFALGTPGVFLSLLIWLTVREPARGAADNRANSDNEPVPGMKEVMSYLIRLKSYRHIVALFSLSMFVGYGMFTWMPTYLVREFSMDTRQIGLMLGLILFSAGIVGALSSGWIIDRLSRKDTRWSMWTLFIAAIVVFVPASATYLTDSSTVAIVCFIGPAFLTAFVQPAVLALVQQLAPLRMRTVSSALLLLCSSLIGIGLGPVFVGVMSDLLAPRFGDESLRYALLLLTPFLIWIALHSLLGARSLKADLQQTATLAK